MKRWNLLFCMQCFMLMTCFITGTQVFASENEKVGGPLKGQLVPPSILSPAERSELRGAYKVLFTWSEAPGAAAYHIVLARDRRFKNIVYEDRKVVNISSQVENLGYGTYFFKISSVGLDGSEGPFSDMLTFIVVPPPPLKIP